MWCNEDTLSAHLVDGQIQSPPKRPTLMAKGPAALTTTRVLMRPRSVSTAQTPLTVCLDTGGAGAHIKAGLLGRPGKALGHLMGGKPAVFGTERAGFDFR